MTNIQVNHKKKRDSNLELSRVVLMLIIIAHHYVVNSGFLNLFDFQNITGNMIFLQIVGFGGKMAINSFVLLSSYFMCTQKLTYEKVLKLITQVYFYTIIIYGIFLITGYEDLSLKSLIKTIFYPIYGLERGFAGSFIAFYLLIPFLNIFLQNLDKKTHLKLIIYSLILFTLIPTFMFHEVWSYLAWYTIIFFIGAYIRLYPNSFIESKKYATIIFTISLALIFISILTVDFMGSKFGFLNFYHLCSDSNKLLALTGGVSFFLLFKNIKIKSSRTINTLAASTFGVLLIHANSDAMRTFLWEDLLKNTLYYDSPSLPIHFFLSIISVYIVCIAIDLLRIKYIENPLFNKLEKHSFLKNECFRNKEDHE